MKICSWKQLILESVLWQYLANKVDFFVCLLFISRAKFLCSLTIQLILYNQEANFVLLVFVKYVTYRIWAKMKIFGPIRKLEWKRKHPRQITALSLRIFTIKIWWREETLDSTIKTFVKNLRQYVDFILTSQKSTPNINQVSSLVWKLSWCYYWQY